MLRALFTQDKKYRIGKLKPFIYLYSKQDTVINFNKNECYKIDSTDSYILHCDSAKYTSSSADNGMYQFKSSVEIVLDERETVSNYDVLKQLLAKEWYVGIVTQEGDRFLMSPEFAAEVTYTYTANDTEKTNNTTVVFTVNTNVPNINVLPRFTHTYVLKSKECKYTIGDITELRLCKSDLTTVSYTNNTLILTGTAVEEVDYITSTLVFQEQYDGESYTQTLQFQIPFEAYQHDFHYEFLEFVNNEYYALLQTTSGMYILSGFEHGLLPSYTIASSEDNSPNKVQITLEYKSSTRGVILAKNVSYVKEDRIEFIAKDWNCIDGVYMATLLEERKNDVIVGYWCYEFMQGDYDAYDIINTYQDHTDTRFGIKLYNESITCTPLAECAITGLPSTITFTEVMEQKTFTIQSPCEPTFFETDKYTLRYSGDQLTVINLGEEDYSIVIMDGDGSSYLIDVKVVIPTVINTSYFATAKLQILKVDAVYGLSSVESVTSPLPIVQRADGNGWNVALQENTSTTEQRTYIIDVKYNNGNDERITITQDHLYERLVNDGIQQCNGNDLYSYLTRYIGYYPDDINIYDKMIEGELIETNSQLCGGLDYTIKAEPASIAISYEGGLKTLYVSVANPIANTFPLFRLSDDWFRVEQLEEYINDSFMEITYQIDIQPNDSSDMRVGTITFNYENALGNLVSLEVTVSQTSDWTGSLG